MGGGANSFGTIFRLNIVPQPTLLKFPPDSMCRRATTF